MCEALIPHWLRRGSCRTEDPEDDFFYPADVSRETTEEDAKNMAGNGLDW